jgi:hypothetical protein
LATINEAVNQLSTGNADLAGLSALSLDQSITFTQYIRYVLPLDGYVFWLRTQSTTIPGSLHVSIDKRQEETLTNAVNRVVFSTGTAVQQFNDISPDRIWIGEWNNQKFAFTRSDGIYDPAGIFYYMGDAVYSDMLSQLVDVGDQLDPTTLVVSNSLPLWLSLKSYIPIWLVPPNPLITLYPSFAVPDNLPPPYGVVHIEPSGTRALQAIPNLGPVHPIGRAAMGTLSGTALSTTHWQLTADMVRITLIGTTNQQALDFQDLVNRYSYDQDLMGLMNTPVFRDDKRKQAELGILAMMKTAEFEVSYYQNRVDDVARQLLLSATETFIPTDFAIS